MNVQKPVYLMAGGSGRGVRSSFSILRSIIKNIGKVRPIVTYVGVASGDNWVVYLMTSVILKAARNCQVKRVLIASKRADIDKAREILTRLEDMTPAINYAIDELNGYANQIGKPLVQRKKMSG